MKRLRVEEAIGETLCHDMTGILPDGTKGAFFKRGHVISEEDIAGLLDIGKNHVFVWEPEADEVHEEEAALAVSEAVCGEGVTYDKKPAEGKVQMTAACDGLFVLNREGLCEVNAVPDFTLATIPGSMRVKKGDKLCGARIVPLVTKRKNVERAAAAAREYFPVLSVLPFKKLKCGVIITGDEVYYGRIEDRFEPIMRKKLDSYGAEILGVVKCPDDACGIIEAARSFVSSGAELVIFTGGMSVDPDDVTPSAIRGTGAQMVTQGVPMQPGNMLTVAYLGDTVLVGVPSASMHSPVTSLDVYLPKIFAGVKVTREEIAGLGEGGLCLACKECTYPVCYFGHGV